MKSKREYEVARDKLLVYGLSEDEVEKVKDQAGSQKARMTLRSPADGIVITRDVVVGNLYDEDDTLLVIAPLDHLWVWGNVFESDLDLVALGQSWEIQFPFLSAAPPGKGANTSRTGSIPARTPCGCAPRSRTPRASSNPTCWCAACSKFRRFQAGRSSRERRWSSLTADYYVFVRVDGPAEKFERRAGRDRTGKGRPCRRRCRACAQGEVVVSVGSLLLAQLYEDMKTAQTGAPPDDGPGQDEH